MVTIRLLRAGDVAAANGKITTPAEYGVVLTPADGVVDEMTTKKFREVLARQRWTAAGP
jgi:hypothetical protein